MISVKQGQEMILWDGPKTNSQKVFLSESLGRILSEDIISAVPQPLFDNSAVDGYGIRIQDLNGDVSTLDLVGEIKAGDAPNVELTKNQAVRIFTGASVPPSADTVVMQEQVDQDGSRILIHKNGLEKSANIRRAGEQIEKGGLAMSKGSALNATAIGYLASMGNSEVVVAALPKIGLIITGNEFLEAGDQPKAGKIYESNGIMLQNVITQYRCGESSGYVQCEDSLEALQAEVSKQTQDNDVILLTGGVSVGDYDFTSQALENEGFEIIFHKVNQKPGKPLLYARKGDKVAFGLPGNPMAVLVCFYEYVYPHLRSRMGSTEPFLSKTYFPLANDFERKAGREQFIAARFTKNGLSLQVQGSHMLQAFSEAEAIAYLEADTASLKKGELLEVHLLT